MGFMASVFEGRSVNGPTSTLREPDRTLLQALGVSPSSAGVNVTEAKAEGLPTVYGCVDVISSLVGWVPLKLMRMLDEGGEEPAYEHEIYALLHDMPNHLMTAYDFKTVVDRWKLLWGTGYAEIERDARGRVTGLWPLRTDRMEGVRTNAEGRLVWRYRLPDGSPKDYVWDPVRPPLLRVMINSLDGIVGRSPIRVLMDSLGGALAARDYGSYLWANRGVPGGVLTFKNNPKPAELERNKENWNRAHSGASNAGKTAVLTGEVTYTPIGIPPQEAQFIELLGYQRTEIRGSIYRVPGFLLGDTEKSTSWGTGLEQQMRGFLTATMEGHFTSWEQAVARDLLTAKSFNTHRARFQRAAMTQSDLKQLVDAIGIEIDKGLINPDEGRALLNLGPRKDGQGGVYKDINAKAAAPGTPPAPDHVDPPADPTPDPQQ